MATLANHLWHNPECQGECHHPAAAVGKLVLGQPFKYGDLCLVLTAFPTKMVPGAWA